MMNPVRAFNCKWLNVPKRSFTVLLRFLEDVMAHICAWSLNALSLKDLIKIAVKPQTLHKVEAYY